MATDRQHQITALYHAARERDERERAAFLGKACAGDDALRRDVESLLGYDEAATPFLERPALEQAAPLVTNNTQSDRHLAGRRIGVYQIEARIGAGGMGEVYRARDSKLGREVAIKVLPSHLMADTDRRARFEREARLLATLNHPHIAQVYGLEESEGLQALVMELVPGETLEAILGDPGPHGTSGRALPLDQALHIARQIADALDAAHEKGIVHRDLKPGNVMIQGSWGATSRDATTASRPRTPRRLEGDLIVKVLDFGLAKATAGDAPGADLTQLPTITADGTRHGVILGTPAYMSPEQARGKPVDKRTDIWAFGCVLYEMLTERLAFAGETTSDTIAAILEREPDWTALPEATPDTIRHLLQRCLEKDPRGRLRDIGDARAEIAIARRLEATRSSSVQATSRRAEWLGPRLGWFVTALVAIILSLVAVPWQWRPRGAVQREPEVQRLTHDPGLQTDAALSPDGQFIAYTSSSAGNFDVWVRQIDGGSPHQITSDPAHDWQPDWSPRGNQLVFRSEREGGGIMVVPAFGGTARRVSSFGYRPRWSADGSRVLFLASNAIGPLINPYTVKLDGTPPQPLGITELSQIERQGAWGWNRNGGVTFLGVEAADFTPRLSTIDPERGTTVQSDVDEDVKKAFKDHQLTIERGLLAWAPDQTAIYFVGESKRLRSLWKIDIEPGSFAITGGPRRLTTMAEANSNPSISRDGQRMAFGAATGNSRISSYALNKSGTEVVGIPQALTPAEMEARAFALSPDGSKIVFLISRPGSAQGREVRVRQLSTGEERTLDVKPGEGGFQWSPDGLRLAYRYIVPESAPTGTLPRFFGLQSLRILDPRTGESRQLTSPLGLVDFPTAWSHDGNYVISVGMRYKDRTGRAATALGFSTVSLVPVTAAPTAETAVKIVAWSTERGLYQGSMSRDGKWVCFIAFDEKGSGGSQIVVVSSRGDNDWRPVPSKASFDDKPRWSEDGRLLYFVSDRGGLYNVWAMRFDPVAGAFAGDPFQVTRFAGPGEMIDENIGGVEIGVAAGRLVMPLVTPLGGIWMLDGLPPSQADRALGWRLFIVLAALAIALFALTKGLRARTGAAGHR